MHPRPRCSRPSGARRAALPSEPETAPRNCCAARREKGGLESNGSLNQFFYLINHTKQFSRRSRHHFIWSVLVIRECGYVVVRRVIISKNQSALIIVNGNPKILNYGNEISSGVLKTFAFCGSGLITHLGST